MTQKQSPWLEGAYGWDVGESGWNLGMDSNLLKFSFMFDRNVDGVVGSLPPAINGQSYFLTTDNRLYFAVGTTWFSTPTPKWFKFVVRSSGDVYQFDGTSAVQVDSPEELDSRLEFLEVTVNSLGTAASEDIEFFATQAALDVAEANAQTYTDSFKFDILNNTDPNKGAALVGRSVREIQSIAELRTVVGKYDNDQIKLLGYYAGKQGQGGGLFYWDSASVEADDAGLIIQVEGVETGRWRRLYPYSVMTTRIVDASWFGVSSDLADNGALLNALMANTEVEGVDIPAGSFNIVTPVVIPSYIKHFKGAGKRLTKFVQNAADAPANVISTSDGMEYGDHGDFEVQLKISATGTTVSNAYRLLGARRSTVSNIHVEVVGHTVESYSGVGILMDMGTVLNAYTNQIINNTVIGTTVGIWSRGPLTSSVFTRNHTKSLSGLVFSRGSIQSGTTPIVGNQIYANLFQAHSSSTFGMGNGIDFGNGDGALGFTYAFSNQIWGNYIERFEHGIIFRNGAKNNEVGSQEWDSPTNDITDLNTSKDGYSGLDAQRFKIALRDIDFKVEKTGLLVANKGSATFWHEGVNKTHDLAASTTITCSDARRITLNPNGANRSGVILDTTNCEEGQTLVVYITDPAFNVSLSTANLLLNNKTSIVMGNEAAGRTRRIAFELVITEVGAKRWMEISQNVKPA